MTDEVLAENRYAIVEKTGNNYFSKKVKYVQLRKEVVYPEKLFPLEELRNNGLGQVQIQARADRRLRAFLEQAEEKAKKGENITNG